MQDQAAKSARTRILEAAADLFYREGIRAVGVDAVIAHSGVAKMSLYRNFAGRMNSVAAFLDYRDELYWAWSDKVLARHPGDARAQIRAIFEAVGKRTAHPDYRAAPSSIRRWSSRTAAIPAVSWRLRARLELRARLRRWPKPSAPIDPGMLADQLLLVLEGTYVSGQTIGSEAWARRQRRRRPMLLWMPHARHAER